MLLQFSNDTWKHAFRHILECALPSSYFEGKCPSCSSYKDIEVEVEVIPSIDDIDCSILKRNGILFLDLLLVESMK